MVRINRCFEKRQVSDASNSHVRHPADLRRDWEKRWKDGSPTRFHQESIKERRRRSIGDTTRYLASYHVRVFNGATVPPPPAGNARRRYIMRTHWRLLVISCEGGCTIVMVAGGGGPDLVFLLEASKPLYASGPFF